MVSLIWERVSNKDEYGPAGIYADPLREFAIQINNLALKAPSRKRILRYVVLVRFLLRTITAHLCRVLSAEIGFSQGTRE
jgi:hypothetical protein